MAVYFHLASLAQLNVFKDKDRVGITDEAVRHLSKNNERIRLSAYDDQDGTRMESWEDVRKYLQQKRCSVGVHKFSDDKVMSFFNDLFTFKEPINDMKNERSFIERGYPKDLADVVVQCRADAGGFLHSWLQLTIAVNNAKKTGHLCDVERLQQEFSMPVNLNVATEDQLSLCVGREDAQWITKERQLRGNFLGWDDFNKRAGSEKVRKRQEYVALENTFVIPVSFNNATQKMIAQLRGHNFGGYMSGDHLVDVLIQSAPCSSWVDLMNKIEVYLSTPSEHMLSLLQQLFVLPAHTITHYELRSSSSKDRSTLRKTGAFTKKDKTDILKHRSHCDIFTGKRVNLDDETSYVVEHIIEVQLGDLAWQQGPEEIFGCAINSEPYKTKAVLLFNNKVNLNLTTAEINNSKKVLVEAWKKQFVSGYSSEVKPIEQILKENKDKDWVSRVQCQHWKNIIQAMVRAFIEMLLIAFECRNCPSPENPLHSDGWRKVYSAKEMLALRRQQCLTDKRYADAALLIFLEKLYRMISPIAEEMQMLFPSFEMS